MAARKRLPSGFTRGCVAPPRASDAAHVQRILQDLQAPAHADAEQARAALARVHRDESVQQPGLQLIPASGAAEFLHDPQRRWAVIRD